MNKIALIGSGDFAEQVMNLCEEIRDIEIVGCFDGNKPKGTMVSDYYVLGNDDDVEAAYLEGLFDYIFIAIGYNDFSIKERIYNRFTEKIPMAQIIHPTAIINHTAKIGRGVLISQGAIIDKDSEISDNTTILPGVFISHDVHIGRHCFISARSAIAGRVVVGKKSFIGLNCCIRDGIKIGNDVTVGMGTVVIKDIPDKAVVVGNPCRLLE